MRVCESVSVSVSVCGFRKISPLWVFWEEGCPRSSCNSHVARLDPKPMFSGWRRFVVGNGQQAIAQGP